MFQNFLKLQSYLKFKALF